MQKSAAPWKSGALAPRKAAFDRALAPGTGPRATTRAEAHLLLDSNAALKGRSSTVLLTLTTVDFDHGAAEFDHGPLALTTVLLTLNTVLLNSTSAPLTLTSDLGILACI